MMNNILLLISCLAIISCASEDIHNELEPIHVTIFDSDFSMAYTLKYELSDSNISVTFRGGLVGESDSVLFVRDLTTKERKIVRDFITFFPLSSLNDEYVTPYMDDGDHKLFLFKVGKVEKEIHESNYYQSDLGSLVNLCNGFLPKQLQIYYFDDR